MPNLIGKCIECKRLVFGLVESNRLFYYENFVWTTSYENNCQWSFIFIYFILNWWWEDCRVSVNIQIIYNLMKIHSVYNSNLHKICRICHQNGRKLMISDFISDWVRFVLKNAKEPKYVLVRTRRFQRWLCFGIFI